MRDFVLAVLVVGLGLFEWWGCRIDKRLEAWARGSKDTTHRVETYVPHSRPAGETRAKISESIRRAGQPTERARPRHPSGAE